MSGFVKAHKQEWEELAALIERGRKSIRRLTASDRERLDVLYRRTTVHLSRVTSQTSDQQLAKYLNQLTAGAHSLIYLPPKQSLWQGTVLFCTEGFGRAVVRHGRLHLIAGLLLIVGILIGYFAAASSPLVAHALWPISDTRQPGSTKEQLLDALRAGRDEGSGQKFTFAAFLFQNNFKVGLMAMATGFLASIPTVFIMLFNGMLLGVFVAIHDQVGIRAELWAWLLPHGITELGAIVLCGGVGFMLGRAVVTPGFRSQKHLLVEAGREAGRVAIGVGAMLIAAAIIESYVRQSHWSTQARFLFAAGTAVFWILYFGFAAWRERVETRSVERSDHQESHTVTDRPALP